MKILNRFTCMVIFECKCETQEKCVEKAVEEKVSLRCADLRNADLKNANLRNANLWGDKISSCPICLTYGLYYPVWITDRKIKIGCQIHSTRAWENFTDEQIKIMDGNKALHFWKVWKEPILKLAKTHQNKGGEKQIMEQTNEN